MPSLKRKSAQRQWQWQPKMRRTSLTTFCHVQQSAHELLKVLQHRRESGGSIPTLPSPSLPPALTPLCRCALVFVFAKWRRMWAACGRGSSIAFVVCRLLFAVWPPVVVRIQIVPLPSAPHPLQLFRFIFHFALPLPRSTPRTRWQHQVLCYAPSLGSQCFC